MPGGWGRAPLRHRLGDSTKKNEMKNENFKTGLVGYLYLWDIYLGRFPKVDSK